MVHMISTCTATKILYVLPDNVSDVNCPSQPCATLGQYLLDNGSLPVLSDVEYYFLPGEHYVVNGIDIVGAFNFSLIGFGLTQAKLICWSKSYVKMFQSYNVTFRNLMFNQCYGDLFYQYGADIAAGLILYECSYCIVEDIYFYVYGFAGINLFLNSYLSNITINTSIVKPTVQRCSPKFSLTFVNTDYSHYDHDSISINNIYISGYTEICYGNYRVMELHLYQNSYGMKMELYDSQFYSMDQMVLHVQIPHANNSLLIKNCTFKHIKPTMGYLAQIIHGEISTNNVTMWLENCSFYHNIALFLLQIQLNAFDNECIHLTNFTITNCKFSDNNGSLLALLNRALDCKANSINENINVIKHIGDFIMYFSQMLVYMSDVIILENSLVLSIVHFDSSEVTFTKTITFQSNICSFMLILCYSQNIYVHYAICC